MQLEDYFDFSYPDYIGIKGHRLGIHNVLDYFLKGIFSRRNSCRISGFEFGENLRDYYLLFAEAIAS